MAGRALRVMGAVGVAAGAGLLAAKAARWARRVDLRGKVAVVTGGGRGLGFAIVEELVARGCKVAFCGRDAEEVEQAAVDLRLKGAEVYSAPCDAADPEQVAAFVDGVLGRFGAVDVLVNNAGQCFVGPAPEFSADDVEAAIKNIFWVQYHPTMAVLPTMRSRGFGRVVNVTSVGGLVPTPHMAPYCAGKFAATGYFLSLRADLAREGILVGAVAPPPLSDGAPLFVHFRGRAEEEFRWFARGLTASPLAATARKTARVVVDAVEHGDPLRTVTASNWFLSRLHGLLPNATMHALGLLGRTYPAPPSNGEGAERMLLGWEVVEQSRDPEIRALGAASRDDAAPHRPAGVADVRSIR